ncbi:Asparagine synthetase [glutamine-hydrolyzing] 1 [Caulifigura coniformis]|uniref:asparagine synthase (glutamine-hydrolyzing) n=1 Tax=Caulifigura coniformis TaxID=2527983 RepID=A0A517SK31_9PLAN|nr:asparagine synthase (glutamine-hydrolyzing) [Caulifigura coniformis]QDT56476.1 Asparagine synthetase [glutamine-hydrolyzing] 1 [Caulifigura coniformis]
MCGFAGFWQPVVGRALSKAALSDRAQRMANTLVTRGPDDLGVWCDEPSGVAIGFRRLAIRDLSAAGAQPMVSRSGATVLAFNGEIYNAGELKRGLLESGVNDFRGQSDTEILLEAIEEWGLDATLKKCVGMFAIAVWDLRERTLQLARDRFGEKPLYYGVQNGILLFGSELKALENHPACARDVDRASLTAFARHGYVPAPRSIYRGISKLRPGTILSIWDRDVTFNRLQTPRPYWNIEEQFALAQLAPFEGSDDEGVCQLDHLLSDSIRGQSVADVPLGAFLSGGIDSSLVVAQMQRQSRRPIRTFTIGFDAAGFNEAPHAAAVARHLGTDHTELYVTAQQAMDVIPRLPDIYDEPFADSSQIPTFLVSQLARQSVTVSLSGDGGDEIFGGYARFAGADSLWRAVGWIPSPLRQLAALGARTIPGLGRSGRGSFLRKVYHGSQVVGAKSFQDAYRQILSSWKSPEQVVLQADDRPGASLARPLRDRYREMMLLDSMHFLPDDILTKVDRATMSVSLESRSPLLDHRIAEFAWRLPMSMIFRNGEGKWLLRQVLEKYVPRKLFDRPKMGFAVPVSAWLRGPLRTWGDDLLSEGRLRREGYWNSAVVRSAWMAHLAGKVDASARLWPILMFQSWQDRQRTDIAHRRAA